ncbi:helix-turn-helix domain-containing protein [Acuticoccus mangrovi]|uniref:Helix-turn-helix transcriptional regulator n=1 Tax=Acuticoccus mangrovi TaxID=2796142 RepID=A0A934MIH3_9HYPH|nr:AraC family transcriptional regulator [Acuticoccus mangrovi]MBJ3778768.1 helix-turn-helix transcriptional regulator [Acuticoccus mangrovi]
MLNVAKYARLQFVNSNTVPLRKVQMSAPRPWVEWLTGQEEHGVDLLRGFLARHLAHFEFTPSRHIVGLAEQMLRPPPSLTGEIATMHRRARGLEIMSLASAAFVAQGGGHQRPQLMNLRQSERAREYVLDHLEEELTIEGIARAVGASVSALQRHFKEHFGETVFDFIRAQRLERARDALEREGVTISQASHLAGYASASSFTTAFKRAYGMPPGRSRR